MIKAVIFDCFGVIYPDTLTFVERAFLPTGAALREDIRLLRRQCDMGQVTREEFWDGVANMLGVSRDQLDAKLDEVRGADWELLEYVKSLRSTYKTAMLSNVGKGFLERIFDSKHPQADYFDVTVASSDIGVMKPEPEAYQVIANRLGVLLEECVFVDDLQKNVDGAISVGMQGILYRDFEQMKRDLTEVLARKT